MLMILSGFSGSGKNTVINALLKEPDGGFTSMPTYTTRAMREGEREGFPYHFLTEEQFREKIASGELYEYEFIHKSFYGSSKKLLAEALSAGKTVIKDIDVKGAMNLKRLLAGDVKVVTVFLYVGKEELTRRLRGRGDSEEDIALRLSRLPEESGYMEAFDYRIENTDLAQTLAKIREIAEKESEK